VHDAVKIISTFTDTKPIGVFRIDVSTIYNEKDHAFERKWAQLINPIHSIFNGYKYDFSMTYHRFSLAYSESQCQP
ncbi:unnamed protein product, partial [Rotaria sp. Silwood1]